MENNRALGKTYTDDDLLRFIVQINAGLLTQGIRGTYVYACDPGRRIYLPDFIASSSGRPAKSALNSDNRVVL